MLGLQYSIGDASQPERCPSRLTHYYHYTLVVSVFATSRNTRIHTNVTEVSPPLVSGLPNMVPTEYSKSVAAILDNYPRQGCATLGCYEWIPSRHYRRWPDDKLVCPDCFDLSVERRRQAETVRSAAHQSLANWIDRHYSRGRPVGPAHLIDYLHGDHGWDEFLQVMPDKTVARYYPSRNKNRNARTTTIRAPEHALIILESRAVWCGDLAVPLALAAALGGQQQLPHLAPDVWQQFATQVAQRQTEGDIPAAEVLLSLQGIRVATFSPRR